MGIIVNFGFIAKNGEIYITDSVEDAIEKKAALGGGTVIEHRPTGAELIAHLTYQKTHYENAGKDKQNENYMTKRFLDQD